MKDQMAHNNVELCLEVEMEEGIKEILASPERCRSALLDVTVIKPKELEAFGKKTTNVLPAGEVKKLIASLERQKHSKKKQIDKLAHNRDSPVRHQNQQVDIRSKSPSPRHNRHNQDTRRENFNTASIRDSLQPLLGHIKRSLHNVEKNINNINHELSKDVLIYQQGGGLIYSGDSDSSKNDLRDLRSLLTCKKSNQTEKKEDEKCFCENCGIIGFIREFQNKTQEPERDTFPRSKKFDIPPSLYEDDSDAVKYKKNQYLFYIDQLTKKVEHLEERLAQQEQKAVHRDYFKRIINRIVSHVTPKIFNNKTDIATNVPIEIAVEPKNEKATATDPNINSNSFWRWSGEILKPGIDLKNKIMNLLCDVFSKFSVSDYKGDKKEQQQQTDTKVYSVRINNPCLLKTNDKSIDFQFSPNTQDERKKGNGPTERSHKDVDVSYVNPNIPQWHKESASSDEDYEEMVNKLAKREFIKFISNTAEAEKEALWETIWAKAKANGQNKTNLVIMKIKDKDRKSVFTAKFTLGEVENLLINHLKYRITPAKKLK